MRVAGAQAPDPMPHNAARTKPCLQQLRALEIKVRGIFEEGESTSLSSSLLYPLPIPSVSPHSPHTFCLLSLPTLPNDTSLGRWMQAKKRKKFELAAFDGSVRDRLGAKRCRMAPRSSAELLSRPRFTVEGTKCTTLVPLGTPGEKKLFFALPSGRQNGPCTPGPSKRIRWRPALANRIIDDIISDACFVFLI